MKAFAATSAARGNRARPGYELWTLEELRAFGSQLLLPNARHKSRSELLEILDVNIEADQTGMEKRRPHA